MKLTGQLYTYARAALMEAFNNDSLAAMLLATMDIRLDHIADGNNFGTNVHLVISHVNQTDQQEELITGARFWNPTNDKLFAVAQMMGLSSTTLPRVELESILSTRESHLDVAQWREKLGAIETQTCKIEVGDVAIGTGLLVGPAAVLTNYHVIKPVLENSVAPSDIVVRFDYKQTDSFVNNGKVYKVKASDWLLDHSVYSQYDLEARPKTGLPNKGELDYALLQLEEQVGILPIVDENGDYQRGWVDITQAPSNLANQANDIAFIVQHPDGQPMKLNFGDIEGTNLNQTRFTYQINTEPGSSGSPCFDRDWNLIGIHHAGDPNTIKPEYNEGIPIGPIIERLHKSAAAAAALKEADLEF